VPDLQYSPGVNPVLTATHLDVTIVFACSGLAGVRLFQILWGLVLVVDWETLNKKRMLFAYFAGLGVMLIANALRISLLVAVGNRISPDFVVNNHITAGWIFFTAVFTAYIFAVYRWLLVDLRPDKPLLRTPF
jgi:exosortase/archaeosortase family protein